MKSAVAWSHLLDGGVVQRHLGDPAPKSNQHGIFGARRWVNVLVFVIFVVGVPSAAGVYSLAALTSHDQIDYSVTYPVQIAAAVASLVGIAAMLSLIRRSDRRPAAALIAYLSFMATVMLLCAVPVAHAVGFVTSYNLGVVILLGFVIVTANGLAIATFLTGLIGSIVAFSRPENEQAWASDPRGHRNP